MMKVFTSVYVLPRTWVALGAVEDGGEIEVTCVETGEPAEALRRHLQQADVTRGAIRDRMGEKA